MTLNTTKQHYMALPDKQCRLTHNLKVVGSNPTPATIVICTPSLLAWGCLFFGSVPNLSKAESSP